METRAGANIDALVLNIMEKRFGDTDLDQDVDIHDFDTLAMNFYPLSENISNRWSQGNSDGDGDVDITDVLKLVLGFAPSGYTPVSVPLWTASEKAMGAERRYFFQVVETKTYQHWSLRHQLKTILVTHYRIELVAWF